MKAGQIVFKERLEKNTRGSMREQITNILSNIINIYSWLSEVFDNQLNK